MKARFFMLILLNTLYHFIYPVQTQIIDTCTKWNETSEQLIFGNQNSSAADDETSLNLLYSSLHVSSTNEMVLILDDQNRRAISFNRSNIAILAMIFFDSQEIRNSSSFTSTFDRHLLITHDRHDTIFILHESNNELIKIENFFKMGYHANLSLNDSFHVRFLSNHSSFSSMCIDPVDGTIFLSDYKNHQIISIDPNVFKQVVYVGTGIAGKQSNQLMNPTTIAMNDRQQLFVHDWGNDRIQMFSYQVKFGRTIIFQANHYTSFTVYGLSHLVLNTNRSVDLFNLAMKTTSCLIGCLENHITLHNTRNALIDFNVNLIVSDSHRILSYSSYQKCANVSSIVAGSIHCSTNEFAAECLSINDVCLITNPCLNNGKCMANSQVSHEYYCTCPPGFSGRFCQIDERSCKPESCSYRGICVKKSNTSIDCRCFLGYEGNHCELTSNICNNITCQNFGICFSRWMNFTCKCLPGFKGKYCEFSERSLIYRRYASQSVGYVAILMMILVLIFVIVMDLLKYIFDIDPIKSERRAVRRSRYAKCLKKRSTNNPSVKNVRFQYSKSPSNINREP